MAASSASPVVSPAVACTPVTPRKNMSACTACAASTAAAPLATAECLKMRPPMRSISTCGWSSRAAATVGLCVTTVARRSCGRALATASAVVPAVEDDHAAGGHHARRLPGHPLLALGVHLLARGVVAERRAHRQGAAVDPLAQAGGGEVAQVTPDAVLRDAQLDRHVARDQPAVPGQAREQQLATLGCQHDVLRLHVST